MNIETIFQRGIDTLFCLTLFETFEIVSVVEKPFPIDDVEDKENQHLTINPSPAPEDPMNPSGCWEVVVSS